MRITHIAAVGIGAVALLLAGCGGDDKSSSRAESSSIQPESPPPTSQIDVVPAGTCGDFLTMTEEEQTAATVIALRNKGVTEPSDSELESSRFEIEIWCQLTGSPDDDITSGLVILEVSQNLP